jgi:hypothetical protein
MDRGFHGYGHACVAAVLVSVVTACTASAEADPMAAARDETASARSAIDPGSIPGWSAAKVRTGI